MKVYVDRNKLYEWFDPNGNGIVRIHVGDVDTLPLEDVAPVRHGWWMEMVDSKLDTHTGEYYEEVYYNCLECDYASDWKSPYCPQCGAKMHELNDKFDGAKAITIPKWEG